MAGFAAAASLRSSLSSRVLDCLFAYFVYFEFPHYCGHMPVLEHLEPVKCCILFVPLPRERKRVWKFGSLRLRITFATDLISVGRH